MIMKDVGLIEKTDMRPRRRAHAQVARDRLVRLGLGNNVKGGILGEGPQPRRLTWVRAGINDDDLPSDLLFRIKNSDPVLVNLDTLNKAGIGESKCADLAHALSLNSRVTGLNLENTSLTPSGCSLLFSALGHLTSMTSLNLRRRDVHIVDALSLCGALMRLKSVTFVDLQCLRLPRSRAASASSETIGCTSASVIW